MLLQHPYSKLTITHDFNNLPDCSIKSLIEEKHGFTYFKTMMLAWDQQNFESIPTIEEIFIFLLGRGNDLLSQVISPMWGE